MNSKSRAGATAPTSCLTLPAALPPKGRQSYEEGLAREQELPRERVCCERVHWQRSGVSAANGTQPRNPADNAQRDSKMSAPPRAAAIFSDCPTFPTRQRNRPRAPPPSRSPPGGAGG